MALAPGTSVGTYEIISLLGTGGMGEVYRARDRKLNRDVALKVLPDAFALDADRLARFKREAQVLASLNHPNIAAIYGFEDAGGIHALVLELVDGQTLADRIAEGAIPLDEALPIARQITEGLEAAHEQGIIHRDLKPANIKLTAGGDVKVLDFGLAKLTDADGGLRSARLSAERDQIGLTNSPTITSPAMMTGAGMILGTAAYMSPEQAKGRPADKRSDIWAFGCVLFEMLTGKRAFEGEDVSDTLAAVLRGEPEWTALTPATSPAIRTVIKRCVEKDRRQRIGDVAAVLFVLREPMVGVPVAAGAPTIQAPPVPLWRRAMPFVLIAAVIGALGVVAGRMLAPPATRPAVSRSVFVLPEGQTMAEAGNTPIAISRDGTQMAYWAERRIYLRSMTELDARPIAGTELPPGFVSGALTFSPDGRSIAFWSGNANSALTTGVLKRVAVTGGVPVSLCQIPFTAGMSWGSSGIVFTQLQKGILRVGENGGQPELLVAIKDGMIWGPQLLPGEQSVLFTLAPDINTPTNASLTSWDNAKIVVQSLKSGERKTVRDGGSGGRYLSSGHLAYALGGVIFAVPFDLARLTVTGGAVPVVEGVKRPNLLGSAPGSVYYAVSDNGSLVYVPGPVSISEAQSELAFSDRKGSVERLGVAPRAYRYPRVSPDGKRVAVESSDGETGNIWIYDLSGAAAIRQLTLGGKNAFPVWSPDSQWVAFQSDRQGDLGIFRQRADGGAAPERLTTANPGTAHIPESWSPDGRTLSFSEVKGDAFTLWMLSLPDRKPTRFGDVQSKNDPITSMFSPDGRWIAYTSSDGSGRTIFVQEMSATGIKHPIAKGAWHPLWSADGGELFYRTPGTRQEVVRITTKPSFGVSNPEAVPTGFTRARGSTERDYDIMPDGKRFIGVVAAGQAPSLGRAAVETRINVVLNWLEELKQRVPTR